MTAVVFDETAKFAGQPMVHAIIIGVSDYAFLPDPGQAGVPGGLNLQKLTAAASSAVDVAAWLARQQGKLVAPIGSIRLCASQIATQPHPPAGASDATRQTVATALHEWRQAQQPDDIAFFYFAGHGIQRNRADMVLLCADFNAPHDGPLNRAVELTNVWGGLGRNVNQATVGKTQIYFVDACRERPKAIANFEDLHVPDVWGVPNLNGKDDRHAPIFYATTPGSLAYADPNVATLFSKTLLRCLENEAATLDDDTGNWQITSKSLERALASRFRALAGTVTDQECDADHSIAEFVISRLASPPQCTLRIHVDPDAAVPATAIRITDLATATDTVLPAPLQPHPFDHVLPGGYYRFSAEPQLPFTHDRQKPRLVEPSRSTGSIRFKVQP